MIEQLTPEESRQGHRGRPVLIVLGVSVALMVAALFGLVTWQGRESPPDYASQSQAASRLQVTGSETGKGGPSSTNSSGVPGGNPAYPQPSMRSTQ